MVYFFANWKSYLGSAAAQSLARELGSLSLSEDVTAVLLPSALSFAQVQWALKDSPFAFGAQTVSATGVGAFTGALSAIHYAEAGATYALVGHSERRHIFGETNAEIRKEIEAALAAGLTPVLCIGDTAEEREQNKREDRLSEQLRSALGGLVLSPEQKVLIAYEPVWAISVAGVGTPCAPSEAQEVHAWIKKEASQYLMDRPAVLYGGSVSSQNISSYLNESDVDGVLVGHASTDISAFRSLVTAITHK